MKLHHWIGIPLGLTMASCASENNKPEIALEYPLTAKVDQQDSLWGTLVKDPYRWLEDDRSAETEAWVQQQNEVTFGYLDNIPFKDQIKQRITTLWDYESVSAPFKIADRYFLNRNSGLQNQSVIYVKNSLDGEEEVYLDPNTFSEDGTVALAGTSFTQDGTLVAISIQESGSDWRKVIVMDAHSKEVVGDTLKDVKFSGITWDGTKGFFYSSYDKPEGSELSAMTDQHKLYYHTLGEPQSADKLIFGGESLPRRYVGAGTTENRDWLFVTAAQSTSGNELYVRPMDDPNAEIKPIVLGFDNNVSPLHTEGNQAYILTNIDAPNYRLVKLDLSNPSSGEWIDILPETKDVLRSVSFVGGKMIANYLKDAHTVIKQYHLDGTLDHDIELPTVGTAGGFGGKMEDKEVFYYFTSYTYPTTIFHYNIETGVSEYYDAPEVEFNPEQYETKQVFYSSKDGTKVPMFITHKKGIELNGKNPTMLYGYGGFNVSLTPGFSISRVYWLEQGGVYAVPNLRGGGEYGEDWHMAGTQMKKQNVFDDFIAAAEYLISEKYTDSDHLAISGGSNGGLLVGATMTQRPDLMAVALPAVGVLDMLRYHKFTAGAGWVTDYGNADQSQEMFEYLLDYSPVHNVKSGVQYPATMVTTGDHDDRVVPAHSFKFAANLQEFQSGSNPVIIRIETDAGHGSGKPTDKIIQELADQYAFTLYNMGLKHVNNRTETP